MERQPNRKTKKQKPYERMEQRSRNNGSSNLIDAEFKTLVIKMLNELRGSVDELSEIFNKEINT